MAIHCSECGFVNPEGASYCAKCGAFLGAGEADTETTSTYRVGETGELEPVDLDAVVAATGAALVIRSGGGRTGETFDIDGDRIAVGRRPDAGVFLDDVTVSRDHAVLIRRGADYWLDDCGSLNGTYVNRERVESQRLADGDELQIGKYKLTYRAK